jgi:hypothetical protein
MQVQLMLLSGRAQTLGQHFAHGCVTTTTSFVLGRFLFVFQGMEY